MELWLALRIGKKEVQIQRGLKMHAAKGEMDEIENEVVVDSVVQWKFDFNVAVVWKGKSIN